MKPKEIKLKGKPWITPELCHMIRTKNQFLKGKKATNK